MVHQRKLIQLDLLSQSLVAKVKGAVLQAFEHAFELGVVLAVALEKVVGHLLHIPKIWQSPRCLEVLVPLSYCHIAALK